MLTKYKYTKLLNKYLKLLKEKVTTTIITEINTLNKNNVNELKFINNDKILTPPIRAPKNTLFKLTFLFNIMETENNKIKSKKKFNKIIKSTYILI